MEYSEPTPVWMLKAEEDERLCWSFLLHQDWIACEIEWARSHLDPTDPRARAWAFGPVAKLSDLEEFREPRMFARMLIWESAFGKDHPENPYSGPHGVAIERMFEDAFAAKAGRERAAMIELQAERDLLPLARALGRMDVDGPDLARQAKLRSYESVAPESSSASYISALAQRSLTPAEEMLAMKFLSPRIHPGKRRAE